MFWDYRYSTLFIERKYIPEPEVNNNLIGIWVSILFELKQESKMNGLKEQNGSPDKCHQYSYPETNFLYSWNSVFVSSAWRPFSSSRQFIFVSIQCTSPFTDFQLFISICYDCCSSCFLLFGSTINSQMTILTESVCLTVNISNSYDVCISHAYTSAPQENTL